MNYAQAKRELLRRWPSYVARFATLRMASARLPKHPRILGTSMKVEKGTAQGILTAIVYMSPATESGLNFCPFATEGCAAACLGHSSGQLALDDALNARLWKTLLFRADRKLFKILIGHEIRAHARKAQAAGMIPAVRFDGSTDTGYGAALARAHADVQFYDYTKDAKRAKRYASEASNYHVTFSWSGENATQARAILRAGGNVAVPFAARTAIKGRRPADPLPKTFLGFPCVDADDSDARFLDPKGTVAALRFKGPARNMVAAARAGFVVDPARLTSAGYFAAAAAAGKMVNA